ncbi:uncharacterized protein LOC115240131 [Formica exsecta]|uniref:uncharacterized protein LOC115240131 n=1 Tax=Formica exsecta TaxID=72781 RepID=UPI001143B94E|nr:uncharacterized protein LOC115240131 [Formica exsecta]
MMPHFIRWPNNAECEESERVFRIRSRGFPGVCDHTGKFIDCLIGRPGRAYDATVFRSSVIYAGLTDQANPLLPPQQYIKGDSAYPLLQNVMTPFRDNGNLTPDQSTFNTRLFSIRSIIERA